jgi:hypothetical protein
LIEQHLPLGNAYYVADLEAFFETTSESILGTISSNTTFSVDALQRDAWLSQIEILRLALEGMRGTLFFEFIVPRIGSRIDVVLILGPTIFVIEFKVGEKEVNREDLNQVWDYALDLKNFHQASRGAPIVPILVATQSKYPDDSLGVPYSDNVFPPSKCNAEGLRRLIQSAMKAISGEALNASAWGRAPYQPTPTIIEAAQALFSQHSVESISRHDAGKRNLRITSRRVEDLVEAARKNHQKMIIFVTGVPGAGKTLVGLNVATKKRDTEQPTHAVFLSGNAPLVAVLREALTRDEVLRLKRSGQKKVLKGNVGQKVKAFIQLVHHFRDEGLRNELPPADHVVIFDEAQRAWNREMASDFMRRKKGRSGFDMSEPEFLISYLNRHDDWAVVICLVGGGQEINRGEAGISAWLDAVNSKFPSWYVYVSPELTDSEYAAGHALDSLSGRANVVRDDGLHLAVSMRSFRAENVAAFVKAALDCEGAKASEILAQMSTRYPIALTRDLNRAKEWIRRHARGSERYGLVASSSAHRLKPHAIDIRVDIDPIHWFLNGKDDTRSSYYLEDAATEFQVQGLELDWVCMTWDADLRFSDSGWGYHSFVGANWNSVRKEERQQYLKNAYRVLLTRARQGMVIFVPTGEASDPTRAPEFYDTTFNYLAGLGIPVLPFDNRCSVN